MSETDLHEEMPWSIEGNLKTIETLPTGTVTLLLADVAGSTRLWEDQPAEMAAAVSALNNVVDDLIGRHGGVRPVEQGEGDSFVAAFSRASDALACALAMQRALLRPIRLRIGLHTGEVQLRDDANYAGSTINRAARLRDLAHGGQTVLSGATEPLVVDRLPSGAWLSDLGTHPLRDLPRPERVVQLCHADLDNDFPPLRSFKHSGKQHLPAQLTTFIGRREELAEVRRLLSEHHLVTLTGAGGVGKTRLAVECAGRLADEFADGVWCVDLAPITDPGLVPVTAARAIGLPDEPGRSPTEALTGFIGGRRILLLLDNCEHLLDASAIQITALLSACPALTILTTSREPIGVAGEVTWRVPSMSVADDAAALFTDRAQRACPDLMITGDDAAVIARICDRLDGMPLAIELAAARVRALSVREIADSLHDRFRLLTGGARNAVRRQQTLRASVDWSYVLLTETERLLLRGLAVFTGGFDLEGAQAICGAAGMEPYQVLDQLGLLVDKSLVVMDNSSARTRYRMLETVRQYALEKLSESGEADAIRSRHRDHYTDMAAGLDDFSRTDQAALLTRVETEIDNMRAAFAWSLDGSRTDLAAQLACSLQRLWVSRSHIREGLSWMDGVLEGGGADLPATVRAYALADKALLGVSLGNPGCLDAADAALAIARELDDPALLARALTARGTVTLYHTEKAQPYYAEAAELSRALGDRWRLSQVLGWQAHIAAVAGDAMHARAAAEEGLELSESIGDSHVSHRCRVWLASAHFYGGDLVSSTRQLRRLLEGTESAVDLIGKVIVQLVLVRTLSFLGDTADAGAMAQALVRDTAELNDYYSSVAHLAVADAALAAGDTESAKTAGAIAKRLVNLQPETAAMNSATLAKVALAEGNPEDARRLVDDSANGWFLESALITRADAALHLGDIDAAEQDLQHALGIAEEVGAYLGIADTLTLLAAVAGATSEPREAARLLGAADAARKQTGEVRFGVFRAEDDRRLAEVRGALDDEAFDAAWAEGATLSIGEAIAYARRGRGKRKRPAAGWGSLTPTERDVVRLTRDGLSNKEIGTQLLISSRTVQTHLTHVYAKLGVSSRLQLAREATKQELDES